MFKVSQIRWLVTAVLAMAATLVVAAPAAAWEDLERMNGVGQGSLPSADVQKRASIQSNLSHEGRLADQRLGTQVATRTGSEVSPGAARAAHGLGAQGFPVYTSVVKDEYIPGVTDSTTGVMAQVRENARRELPITRPDSDARPVGVEIGSRDHVVADKASPQADPIPYLSHGEGVNPSFGETYVPGVTDFGTGVARDLGVDLTPATTTREVSDDGFSWSSDTGIAITAALLTALLMALGTFALVNQRRRRMAL